MRTGVLGLIVLLAAGCAQAPNPAVYGQLQDALTILVGCIDDDIVRHDDGAAAAGVVARKVVSGCVARHGDRLEQLTDGQAATFLTGFEEGLVDRATEEILAQRANKLV